MSSVPTLSHIPFLDRPGHCIPMVEGLLRAGFPSPADDFGMRQLDLVELLVVNPLATFFWQISGYSMRDAGIWHGDIVVVDRSIRPRHEIIVVAEVDGEFTCKYFFKQGGVVKLVAANPEFEEITFNEGQQLIITGVVTGCVKRFR